MSFNNCRLVIICPSVVVRIGLAHILESSTDFRVCDSFGILTPLTVARLETINPDVVVIDPSALGPAELEDVRASVPSLKDCALVAALNASYPAALLKQFDSTFSINEMPATIAASIKQALTLQEAAQPSSDGLSAREKEVLVLVAKGLTNKEIAEKLYLSVFTVTTHRKNITQKLGIRSIAGLTVYAIINGLVSEDELNIE